MDDKNNFFTNIIHNSDLSKNYDCSFAYSVSKKSYCTIMDRLAMNEIEGLLKKQSLVSGHVAVDNTRNACTSPLSRY